jgi:aminoglycoside phosphotransferase (APT) family kinase protein
VTSAKLHAGEADIDAELVGRLLAEQFPELDDLPITAFRSTGTVNAVFRIGDELYARLPRLPEWTADLDKEWLWLPRLAPLTSLRIPEPFGRGRPGCGYPHTWALYRWIKGTPYADDLVDEGQAAADLAQFVLELRGADPVGAPRGGRSPLADLDVGTRASIEQARGSIDADAALDAWEDALDAPAWDGTPVWIHSDLLRPNLLVRARRLSAVIDFGSAGVGDPATDVIAAWSVFGPVGRETFRDALDVDEVTWRRSRGIALHQAAMIIPYYRVTNPEFTALAIRTVTEVLADIGSAATRSTSQQRSGDQVG